MKTFEALRMAWLKLMNPLDYYLRQRLHPRVRPVERLRIGTPDLIGRYKAGKRERLVQEIERLTSIYHVEYFSNAHTLDEAKENFFYLAMLDKSFERTGNNLPDSITVADIGPSSWFYAHALFAALTWYGAGYPRSVHLTGYEVDPYRFYADFHTRKDHAIGNMRGLPNVEYIDNGFTLQSGMFDVITMFFPFVFEKDHLKWGLPARLFNPESLLNSVWRSLKTGGAVLVVNQGVKEHNEQLKIFERCGIPVSAAFRMEPLIYNYPLDRYIITAKK